MIWKIPKITIQFISTKDIGHVYWLELNSMHDIINVIDDEEELRKVELDLKELIATVENKKAQMYKAKHDGQGA